MGPVKLLLDGAAGCTISYLVLWGIITIYRILVTLFIDPIEIIQGFELCLHVNPVSRFCNTSLLITYIVA